MSENQIIDLVSNLIELNFGTYEDVMKCPYKQGLKISNVLSKDYRDKLKAKQEYDIALMKAFKCPLYSK